MPDAESAALSGRCYCGSCRIEAKAPLIVAYCHCNDCRRVTGAPVGAFAAFSPDDVGFVPPLGAGVSHNPGVRRWFCADCGSPLAATYDYLPGQVYVPIGLFDQAQELTPEIHAHAESRLPWLHIEDGLERIEGSSQAVLQGAARQ